LFHAAPNCKQKDLKNMLIDNLLPELKLKQSNILTMGDFNFDLQNKNFRFTEFMEHTFSSKQIVSKVTRKYESLLDLAFLKVYPAKFYQVSDYRLSRAYLLTLPLFAGVSRVRALSPAWTGSHARETLISRTTSPQQKNQVQ
jgi:hypothetical protein